MLEGGAAVPLHGIPEKKATIAESRTTFRGPDTRSSSHKPRPHPAAGPTHRPLAGGGGVSSPPVGVGSQDLRVASIEFFLHGSSDNRPMSSKRSAIFLICSVEPYTDIFQRFC